MPPSVPGRALPAVTAGYPALNLDVSYLAVSSTASSSLVDPQRSYKVRDSVRQSCRSGRDGDGVEAVHRRLPRASFVHSRETRATAGLPRHWLARSAQVACDEAHCRVAHPRSEPAQ